MVHGLLGFYSHCTDFRLNQTKYAKTNCDQSASTPLPPLRPGPETQWIFGGGGDSAYSTQFSEFTAILGGMTGTRAHSFRETKATDLLFSANM